MTTTASSPTILLSLQSGRQKESSQVPSPVKVAHHTLNAIFWLNALFILATLFFALLF